MGRCKFPRGNLASSFEGTWARWTRRTRLGHEGSFLVRSGDAGFRDDRLDFGLGSSDTLSVRCGSLSAVLVKEGAVMAWEDCRNGCGWREGRNRFGHEDISLARCCDDGFGGDRFCCWSGRFAPLTVGGRAFGGSGQDGRGGGLLVAWEIATGGWAWRVRGGMAGKFPRGNLASSFEGTWESGTGGALWSLGGAQRRGVMTPISVTIMSSGWSVGSRGRPSSSCADHAKPMARTGPCDRSSCRVRS